MKVRVNQIACLLFREPALVEIVKKETAFGHPSYVINYLEPEKTWVKYADKNEPSNKWHLINVPHSFVNDFNSIELETVYEIMKRQLKNA